MLTWDGFPPDEKCLWIDNFKDWKGTYAKQNMCAKKYIYTKKNVLTFELIILKIKRVDIPNINFFTSNNHNSCASCKKMWKKKVAMVVARCEILNYLC